MDPDLNPGPGNTDSSPLISHCGLRRTQDKRTEGKTEGGRSCALQAESVHAVLGVIPTEPSKLDLT